MRDAPQKHGLDWVAIPKRRLYALAVAGLLAAGATAALLYAYLYGNPFDRRAAGAEPAAALVAKAEGDVRVIRAGTRQVERLTLETRLRPGDTVQTDAAGNARVILADGSMLSVTENSVVTIADNTASKEGEPAAVRVDVARGLVSVQTEQQAVGATNNVKTPLTNNRLAASTRASFGVHEDQTEEIRVAQGRVLTTARGGMASAIAGGEYVALDRDGALRRREPLLEAPTPFAPAPLSTISLPNNVPVTLRWSGINGSRDADYQVQIASSPFFVPQGIMLDRSGLQLPHLILNEVRPGAHFWRVRARAASGQLSEWSEPMKFTVIGEPTAPRGKS